MATWHDLDRELALWPEAATCWWRDDDATVCSPELRRLVALSGECAVPVLLAVIPALADASLVSFLRKETSVWVAQHGFAHRNNACAGQRKIELGGTIDILSCLDDLVKGRERLKEIFRGRFLNILVPPWNRIDSEFQQAIAGLHFTRLSMLGPRGHEYGGNEMNGMHRINRDSQINVHVDIVNWQEGRFAGDDAILAHLIAHLQDRRTGRVDGREPTGIMTHHLVMDEESWDFMWRFFQYTCRQEKLFWVGGESLLIL